MIHNRTKSVGVIIVILIVSFISVVQLSGLGASEEQKKPKQQSPGVQNQLPTPTLKTPVYTAPKTEEPQGAFTRTTRFGKEGDFTTLSLLAPNHLGLTVNEQPSLYWYLSQPIHNRIVFTLAHNEAIKPLLKTHLSIRKKTGIQSIKLADYGIRLMPGKQYQWYLKIIETDEKGTTDNITRGLIKCIKPDQTLLAQLDQAKETETPAIYAKAGIWYDAIETTLNLIATPSNSEEYRKLYSSLLTQVGLLEVAEYVIKAEDTSKEQKSTLTKVRPEESKKKFAVPVNIPTYKPPMRGAASNLVGGGTRGTGTTNLNRLTAIVPDHVGLTIQEQPSLFWYLDEPTNSRVEFTLNDPEAISPLLEITLGSNIRPGIQRLNLSDYGAHLAPGKKYKWFVSLVTDPNHRSKDIVTGGFVELREPPDTLLAKLNKTGKTNRHHKYASEGIWYDAFSSVSDLISQSPDDRELRKQRASLLEQVGLTEIAEQEMSGM